MIHKLFFFTIFSLSVSEAVSEYPCKPPHHSRYPFCNTSLDISTRAQSLISLLTLSEKINQLSNNASSIPRLGIPSYQWWSESLHGIATNGPGISFNGTITAATSFPQVLLTAASFNTSLWFSIACAISVEARAMYNLGQAGLTFWAPNINIFRDPRWGRGQETPGEDPFLASSYAVNFVRGFEQQHHHHFDHLTKSTHDDNNRVLKEATSTSSSLMLSACCKHFTAYDLESWNTFSRYSFNAVVSEQDLQDTYQPPFRSCIEQGKASCLMCGYNALNGVPMCASKDFLQQPRTDWGFKGYIASDCDAVATIYEYQHYVTSPEDAVAAVLKAGMDINCGSYMLRHTQSAVEQGKVQEGDIDRALFNLFSVQIRLGLFDGNPAKGQFGNLGPQDVCTPEHRNLAVDAARQGIVLLKNDKKFLPLNKMSVTSLAVIGPAANSTTILGGGYTGVPCNPMSYFDGLGAHARHSYYAAGCTDVECSSTDMFAEAVDIAKMSDVVVVVAGLDLSQETEDLDRVSLLLPGKQMDLISAVANASTRPVVVILTGGGPLDVSFAKDDPRIASILWVGYPGEAGGEAISQIIFGEYNPGGRLPMTWYPESFTSIPMNNMRMRPDLSHGYPGRTYRFYTGDRVYGFGHGLSYTNYTCKFISVPNKIRLFASSLKDNSSSRLYQRRNELQHIHVDELPSCDTLKFHIHVSVINKGDMDGSHVVILFSRTRERLEDAPQKQMIGFVRVHTKSYRAAETIILVDPCKHLSSVNKLGVRTLTLGEHILMLDDLEHSIHIEIQ